MITYVNSENAQKYSVLFDKASEALNQQTADELGISLSELTPEQTVEISSLAEYFENIKSLVLIDKKYTILPVDEEVFEIDANARSIAVPDAFKKNGIGVQGDEIAEILYFKIARYFDATDLNETEIYIQWETKEGIKGLSKEWVRDIESEPGYIIFGWPICSDITKVAGDVKFAVRFYKILADQNQENKFLAYSFGTLTQTVAIKPSLDFNIVLSPDELELIEHNHEQFIIDRMVNSDPASSYATPAQSPVYTLNLLGNEYSEGFDPNPADIDPEERKVYVWQRFEPYTAVVDGDEVERAHAILHVQASSPDAGVITYAWYKVGGDASLTSHIKYIPVDAPAEGESRVLSHDKPLYTGLKSRDDLTEPDVFRLFTGDEYPVDQILYERVSELIVEQRVGDNPTTTGFYYAVATNRVGSSTKSLESNILEIPYPETPQLIDEGVSLVGENAIPVLDQENGVSIQAMVAPIDGEAAIKPHEGTISYEWHFRAPLADNIAEPDDETDVIVEGNESVLTLDETAAEGFYSVIVKNALNGEEEASVESSSIRLTMAPEELVIVEDWLGIAGYVPADPNHQAPANSVLTVTLAAEGQPNFDEITYQWYQQAGNAGMEDDILLTNETAASYATTFGGTFYCVVTNHYNGQTQIAVSQAVATNAPAPTV